MLPPGSQLGRYTIANPLGAGGMTEVYRARDSRLGRDVAIKVLPAFSSAGCALSVSRRPRRVAASLVSCASGLVFPLPVRGHEGRAAVSGQHGGTDTASGDGCVGLDRGAKEVDDPVARRRTP